MKAPYLKNTLIKFLLRGIAFSLLPFSIMKGAAALEQQYLKFDIPSLQQKASQNDAQAQTALCWAYYFGMNVNSDQVQANEWFKKAAANGSDEAALQLGLGYMSGTAGKIELSQSRQWLEKAFRADNADAGIYLGTIYEEGIGVDRDPQKARLFFDRSIKISKKAAEDGDLHAIQLLMFIYGSGHGVPADPDKKNHYLKRMKQIQKSGKNPLAKAEQKLLHENLAHFSSVANASSREVVDDARLAVLNKSFYGYQMLGNDYVLTQS